MERGQSLEMRVGRIVGVWMRVQEKLHGENLGLEENCPVEMTYCQPEKKK